MGRQGGRGAMKLGISQPLFLPWLGFFDLLDTVDLFVALDNVQLTRSTFMVRNRLFSADHKVQWISASVSDCSLETPMNQARLSHAKPWWEGLYARIQESYRGRPHWSALAQPLREWLRPGENESVAAYNGRIILALCDLIGLEMSGRWQWASQALADAPPPASGRDRVMALCQGCHATAYYNFHRGVALGLHSPDDFARQGMALYQQQYDHPTYPQGRPGGFTPYLSILDALVCVGPLEVLPLIRRGRGWRLVPPSATAGEGEVGS
ncbi:MAG: WbqC family protein [Magnetococcales bacterium]|nr:WbqC family protein [Magnetococcales bacterium]